MTEAPLQAAIVLLLLTALLTARGTYQAAQWMKTQESIPEEIQEAVRVEWNTVMELSELVDIGHMLSVLNEYDVRLFLKSISMLKSELTRLPFMEEERRKRGQRTVVSNQNRALLRSKTRALPATASAARAEGHAEPNHDGVVPGSQRSDSDHIVFGKRAANESGAAKSSEGGAPEEAQPASHAAAEPAGSPPPVPGAVEPTGSHRPAALRAETTPVGLRSLAPATHAPTSDAQLQRPQKTASFLPWASSAAPTAHKSPSAMPPGRRGSVMQAMLGVHERREDRVATLGRKMFGLELNRMNFDPDSVKRTEQAMLQAAERKAQANVKAAAIQRSTRPDQFRGDSNDVHAPHDRDQARPASPDAPQSSPSRVSAHCAAAATAAATAAGASVGLRGIGRALLPL